MERKEERTGKVVVVTVAEYLSLTLLIEEEAYSCFPNIGC